jgi:hypothetical protein
MSLLSLTFLTSSSLLLLDMVTPGSVAAELGLRWPLFSSQPRVSLPVLLFLRPRAAPPARSGGADLRVLELRVVVASVG